MTPKPGLYINYGQTGRKSQQKDAAGNGTRDANGDFIYVPVADLPGNGTVGLPATVPPDAGTNYNTETLTYHAVPSGRWVMDGSHYDWKSSLKGTEDQSTLTSVSATIPDFGVVYNETYYIDGNPGATVRGDTTFDDISLGFYQDPSNPPIVAATATFGMDLHDEYEAYTDHVYKDPATGQPVDPWVDWSDPGDFSQDYRCDHVAGHDGDTLTISAVTIPAAMDVEFEAASEELPIEWLKILGVRVLLKVHLSEIKVTQAISTNCQVKAGDYTWARVGKNFHRHVGQRFHFTGGGYVGEVPFDEKTPDEDAPFSVTYGFPYGHSNIPGAK